MASLFLQQDKPNTAVYITDLAINITTDNSRAYLVKGKAQNRLGHYTEAVKNLVAAQKMDFNEEAMRVT
eukprot:1380928-Amorphochlora_amoeboformis.AAC.1